MSNLTFILFLIGIGVLIVLGLFENMRRIESIPLPSPSDLDKRVQQRLEAAAEKVVREIADKPDPPVGAETYYAGKWHCECGVSALTITEKEYVDGGGRVTCPQCGGFMTRDQEFNHVDYYGNAIRLH